MPPSDENTPDFDNMSPEELMAWMETLAERQGAVEGFTTDKRVEIAEVDPNSVADTGPGYIPYGMSEEEWAKRSAKEEEEKAARLAQRHQQQLAAAPAPVAQPEVPAMPAAQAEPVAAMGDTPDFDNMSPEELMAWMETLAERQGAEEGFTTSKRMEIPEVDPSSAADTGPGYIPYGMSEEEWARRRAKEEEQKAARLAQRQQQQPAAVPAPAEPEIPAMPAAQAEPEFSSELPDFASMTEAEEIPSGMDWLDNLAGDTSGSFPEMDLAGLGDELASLDLGGLDETMADVTNPMDWLESIAQDQGLAESPAAMPEFEPEELPIFAEEEANADVDPIEWLESLAARQTNPPSKDEFMTDADLHIPLPEDLDETQAPGYEDYRFEDPDISDSVDLPDFIADIDTIDAADGNDPASWLEKLAESQQHHERDAASSAFDQFLAQSEEDADDLELEAEDEVEDEVVLDKLNKGISDPRDMENWMSALLERGATRSDAPPDYIEDEDEEEAIEAQIPDWLLEQVGPPPDLDSAIEPAEESEPELPMDLDALAAPVAEAEIPDWLQEGGLETEDTENIFAEMQAAPASADIGKVVVPEEEAKLDDLVSSEFQIDTNDPWVAAFEEERTQEGTPEWYTKALAKARGEEFVEQAPAAPTAIPVPAAPQAPAATLQPANLPSETRLHAGEPEAVPSWLTGSGEMPAAAVVEEPVAAEEVVDTSWLDAMASEEAEVSLSDEDVPEWLRQHMEEEGAEQPAAAWLSEVGIDKTDTVPEWLLSTVKDDEDLPEPEPTPSVIQAAPAPTQAVVPVASTMPAPPPSINVQETLNSARAKIQANDVEGALYDYESVVRANAQLDVVVADLGELIKKEPYKGTAAVYRVLGDGLMRVGRLQQALDTYRRALNLL